MVEALLACILTLLVVVLALVWRRTPEGIAATTRTEQAVRDEIATSFELVNERLEAVHRGLGEMQSLAARVGDLQRMLGNVKTRGTWGEVQLGALLDEVLAPGQFARNVAVRPGARERVEFALRIPTGEAGAVVWLPIDSKFPLEDHQRLLEAQERGDRAGADEAGRRLEAGLRARAREIREKYVDPPHTTDFGVLFLPTEGLYADVLRRPGIVERIQADQRVVLAGPTTLAALLNSLQLGLRTVSIQERSSEVWKLLYEVKREIGTQAGLLERVLHRLTQASTTIEDAARRGRTLERRLRELEEPADEPEDPPT